VILYLDASALVKLYVEEEGARRIRQGVEDAEVIATCEIA
jgi:predicted nucleic acid-binding protein